MRFLMVLLALSDLSGQITEYLRAPVGSEREKAAIEAIRVYYDVDPAAVEEAIRNGVTFPATEPGAKEVSVPLPDGKSNPAVVHVPKGYDPSKKWPALLVIHGTGGYADQNVASLAPFADRHGLLLIAPQDTLRAGGGGWGFTDREHAMHIEAVRWLKRNFNVDDRRVFAFGGSRGGHASWELAYSYPEVFAGSIPVVGAVKLRFFRYLPNLMHVPIFDMQGAKDDPTMVEYLRDAIALLRKLDYDVTYKEDPESGHYYPVDWDEVWNWMKDRRRETYPGKVVMVATRDDRARSHWLQMTGLAAKKFERVKPPSYDAGKGPLTREEQKRLIVANYAKYCARVTATVKTVTKKVRGKEREETTIDLEVKKAPKVVIWLGDGLVNMEGKVRIRIAGRNRYNKIPTRSLETLLGRVKETADRDLLYHTRVEVRGR